MAIPCTRTQVTVTYWLHRAWRSSPSFHRWESWDLPGPSGWIKSQQPSLKSQDANQLPNAQENVLSPKPGYLFHGPVTWKPVAASLTAQNYNYMPQITWARGQGPGARAQIRLPSGFAFDGLNEQMVLSPHQGGQGQHSNKNIIIKD